MIIGMIQILSTHINLTKSSRSLNRPGIFSFSDDSCRSIAELCGCRSGPAPDVWGGWNMGNVQIHSRQAVRGWCRNREVSSKIWKLSMMRFGMFYYLLLLPYVNYFTEIGLYVWRQLVFFLKPASLNIASRMFVSMHSPSTYLRDYQCWVSANK